MTLEARVDPARKPTWLGVFTLMLALSASALAASQAALAPIPETIPIFPLQDIVLFPNSTAQLHIFEPRYRAMVADALEGDSIIGMVLLQPGYEADYEGRPPIHAIGAAGVIIDAEELPDGRYNILLDGLAKFRVLSEDASRPYRLAEVEELPDVLEQDDRALLAQRLQQIEAMLLSLSPPLRLPPADLSDEEIVDGLASALRLEPAHRLELLEADGPLERAERLITRLRVNSSVPL